MSSYCRSAIAAPRGRDAPGLIRPGLLEGGLDPPTPRPPLGWQGCALRLCQGYSVVADSTVALSSRALKRFIAGGDPVRDEHLHRICRRGRSLPRPTAASLRFEPREHVVREVPLRIAAPDADPQSRKVGTDMLDHRLETVVSAGRSQLPHAKSAQRQIHIVDDDQHVGRVDLDRTRPTLRPPRRSSS